MKLSYSRSRRRSERMSRASMAVKMSPFSELYCSSSRSFFFASARLGAANTKQLQTQQHHICTGIWNFFERQLLLFLQYESVNLWRGLVPATFAGLESWRFDSEFYGICKIPMGQMSITGFLTSLNPTPQCSSANVKSECAVRLPMPLNHDKLMSKGVFQNVENGAF